MTKGVDYIRIILVFLGALAQIFMGWLPNQLQWEHTISSRSYATQTLVTPAGYAFIIWGVIFLGCIAFSILHALPKNHTDRVFQQLGWLAVAAFWGNAIWEVYVPLRGFDWGSFLLIAIILTCLLSGMFILTSLRERRGAFIPLMLMAGWVSVATFANISTTSVFMDFNPFQLSAQAQAFIIILAAGILTACFAWYFGSLSYTGAASWGLIAIYVINAGRGEQGIAYLALAFGILGIILAVISFLSGKRKRVAKVVPISSKKV